MVMIDVPRLGTVKMGWITCAVDFVVLLAICSEFPPY